jgi:beta-galactosidase
MTWSRRDVLKTGAFATAGIAVSATHAAGSRPNLPLLVTPTASAARSTAAKRERLLLDFNWRFAFGHAIDPERDFGFGGPAVESTFAKADRMIAVAEVAFDDSKWQPIRLPHDWSVALPFVTGKDLAPHGSRPIGRMFPETSVGWYRRHFSIPNSDHGRRIALEFDGIFRDAIVFLNGHLLTRNFSGYAPIRVEIADYANYGGDNVLTVRADASYGEGWFYEGAGIYRHVWLMKEPKVGIAPEGVFVQTGLRDNLATLNIQCEVQNLSDAGTEVRVEHRVIDLDGSEVGHTATNGFMLTPGGEHRFESVTMLQNPRLWSIETPALYKVISTLENPAETIDSVETSFGVRTVRFDPDLGFFLNERPLKIKGTCNHQDHAGVGTAMPDFLQQYRVSLLKQMGSNACRTSHNPATPEFLDECDSQGILVMEEVRMMASTTEGLSQLTRMVRRDRNRPSIILWSLGNEEPEQGTERGAFIVGAMKRCVQALDPTRQVTVAMNGQWGKGISGVVDVQGCNYNRGLIDGFHRQFPRQPMIGTETASTFSTRGEYSTDPKRGIVSAYDVNPPKYGDTAEEWWQLYAERAFLTGGFVWTGFDYRGEPNPDLETSISSQFGILDTCGFPKDNYYYYKAWWGGEPVLHLFPHWNWMAGELVQIWCHSNLDSVELFVNGQSLGEKPVPPLGHVQWEAPFAPGAIEARGRKSGRVVLSSIRETAGPPAALLLSANRRTFAADAEDGCVLTATVVDSRGRTVPYATNTVSFSVDGPAEMIGVGNGDPNSREADRAEARSVFHGLCSAIVRSGREARRIRVTAHSEGLADGIVELEALPSAVRGDGVQAFLKDRVS